MYSFEGIQQNDLLAYYLLNTLKSLLSYKQNSSFSSASSLHFILRGQYYSDTKSNQRCQERNYRPILLWIQMKKNLEGRVAGEDSPCWSPLGTWWCCRVGSYWCWQSGFPQRGWSTCRGCPVCQTDSGHCSVGPQESAQDTRQLSVMPPHWQWVLGLSEFSRILWVYGLPDKCTSRICLRSEKGRIELPLFLWVLYSPLSD